MGMYNAAGFRALLAAVIGRAVDDIKGIGPRCHRKETDRAMAFVLSDTCEAYCLELEIDYAAVREKAAALYRRFLEKEDAEGGGKNRPGRPSNGFRHINTRQSPGKPCNGSYR